MIAAVSVQYSVIPSEKDDAYNNPQSSSVILKMLEVAPTLSKGRGMIHIANVRPQSAFESTRGEKGDERLLELPQAIVALNLPHKRRHMKLISVRGVSTNSAALTSLQVSARQWPVVPGPYRDRGPRRHDDNLHCSLHVETDITRSSTGRAN